MTNVFKFYILVNANLLNDVFFADAAKIQAMFCLTDYVIFILIGMIDISDRF